MALKQATAILKESGSLKRPSQKTDAPTFRAPEGDSTVWVEGDPCFEFNDVDQAVLGFVLSHSVLNCSFGKRYRGIASFIQRYTFLAFEMACRYTGEDAQLRSARGINSW